MVTLKRHHFFIFIITVLFIINSSNPSYGQESAKTDTMEVYLEPIQEGCEPAELICPFPNIPKPVGGFEKFYDAIYKELKVPKDQKTPTKTFVKLTIDSAGAISKLEVLKGATKSVDEEILRALKKLDYPFEPVLNDETTTQSFIIIPVMIKP